MLLPTWPAPEGACKVPTEDCQMWATAVKADVCILALSNETPIIVKIPVDLLARIRCLECRIR